MAEDPNDWDIETKSVRGGMARSPYGEISEALFLTQSFAYDSAQAADERFAGGPGFIYQRFGNPTTQMFEDRLAQVVLQAHMRRFQAESDLSTRMPCRRSTAVERLGADERGMRMYVLCILKTGPKDAEIKGDQRKEVFAGHFANIGRLADEGKLAVAGPFGIGRGDRVEPVDHVVEAVGERLQLARLGKSWITGSDYVKRTDLWTRALAEAGVALAKAG